MTDLTAPGTSAKPVLRDVMTVRVATVPPDSSVADAAARMVSARVGSAVVILGNFLVGILTERDVLKAAASGTDLTVAKVHDWMTPDPQSVSPDTTAEEAAQIMLMHGFRHLPVVDGRAVCGVVSLRDLFSARIRRRPPQPA